MNRTIQKIIYLLILLICFELQLFSQNTLGFGQTDHDIIDQPVVMNGVSVPSDFPFISLTSFLEVTPWRTPSECARLAPNGAKISVGSVKSIDTELGLL